MEIITLEILASLYLIIIVVALPPFVMGTPLSNDYFKHILTGRPFQLCKLLSVWVLYHVNTYFVKKTGSSFYCFIFEVKKITAAILVRPLCYETSVCKSIH